MTDSNPIGLNHSVDDTVRVATGFVMGGITASFFDFSIVAIIIIGVLLVLTEWVYGFFSVMYEARGKYNSKLENEKQENNQETGTEE